MTASGKDPEELQRRIQILEQQLLQAQKLTALGELVSTTTHEFNNILTTIINYSKLGLRHKDDKSRQKAFEKILSAGERAAKITNSVLGMARNRSNAFEPTDLAQIIQETLVLLEREFYKYRMRIELHLNPVPLVNGNGNQLQQVLLNLLINARQALSTGGQVTIKLDHDPGSDMVDLVIRDTGSGIPAEALPNIFDPFFTTKRGPDETGKGGTGLGLACCRQVIEAHRGRIRVESTVGKGTAFTLKLPVAATRSAVSPKPAAITKPEPATSTASG